MAKKVRTERDVRNDPRVSEIDFGGWTIHEATWGDVCWKLNDYVVEGEPY